MKLTNAMRSTIADRIVAKVRPPREAKLRAREQALAIRLIRHRFGDDVFDRCRELPAGWLNVQKHVSFEYGLTQTLPRKRISVGVGRYRCERAIPDGYLTLAEYVPLPNSNGTGLSREAIGEALFEEIAALFQAKIDLEEDVALLRNQVTATLSAFTTVERLAADWPEGYAELPAEAMAPKVDGLPAPRIADLNARIAAVREAA
jgi:hypothetical protein